MEFADQKNDSVAFPVKLSEPPFPIRRGVIFFEISTAEFTGFLGSKPLTFIDAGGLG
jgi:hypothetical protein